MSRISIEVTPEEHQRLKAVAALHGKTIKEYVLERVLAPLPETAALSEEQALEKLEAFLKSRIEAAERGDVVSKSGEQIFEEVRCEEPAGQ
ncbi:MAG: antitoxin [Xenococcaceae cyanobacterium]